MKLKKLLAVGIAVVMMTGLAACGGGDGGTSGGGESIADIMKKAEEALENVGSMNYDMVMDMEMSAQGQTMASSTSGQIAYIADPLKMKMDMTVDAGGQSTAMQMYAEQIGDDYAMYMSMDGTNWMKQTITDAAELEQYSAEASMDMYLESAESFKEAGEETVNGMDAVKYEGVIAEDTMNEVMENAGMVEQLAGMGISEEQAEAMYKDLGQLPIAIWIAKDSGLPVKYEMDMTEFMQKLMDNVMAEMGEQAEGSEITVGKMMVSMTISGFDSVEDFEIPEAAKNAQEAAF